MPDWTAAGNVPELNALFNNAYAQPSSAPTDAPAATPTVATEPESSNILVKSVKKILDTIDNGSFFRRPLYWLYIIFYCLLALALFVCGIAILITAVSQADSSYSNIGGTFGTFGTYLFGLFSLIIGAALATYTVIFGLNRAKKLNSLTNANDDIFVIPLVAYCYQTLREWLGTTIMIGGTLWGVVIAVLGVLSFKEEFYLVFIAGIGVAIGSILVGYLVVFLGHFIANFLSGFASLVNNMKRTEINTRK